MYRPFYRHILSRVDAELIHNVTMIGLHNMGNLGLTRAIMRQALVPSQSMVAGMSIQALGLDFAHPVGLAAGLDKDGRIVNAIGAFGFSFAEIGTVTPRAQPGNSLPRMFRLTQDHALINRMGFPSAGMATVAANLQSTGVDNLHHWPIGVSLGKNKETPLLDAHTDYSAVLDCLYPYADFFVINVSSPNTPDLRKLQTREYLADLLAQVTGTLQRLGSKPLLVKISPDLSWAEIDTLLELVQQYPTQISGIIATNTTIARDGLTTRDRLSAEVGGLSGHPLAARSTEVVRYVYRQTHGKLLIIGVGGIFSADDVWEKLGAGATLVQGYTGFVYEGPTYVRQIIAGLRRKMDAAGIQNLREIIGSTAR